MTSLRLFNFAIRVLDKQEKAPTASGDDLARVLEWLYDAWELAESKGELPSQRRGPIAGSPPGTHPAVA